MHDIVLAYSTKHNCPDTWKNTCIYTHTHAHTHTHTHTCTWYYLSHHSTARAITVAERLWSHLTISDICSYAVHVFMYNLYNNY